jgi:hypothetical protein
LLGTVAIDEGFAVTKATVVAVAFDALLPPIPPRGNIIYIVDDKVLAGNIALAVAPGPPPPPPLREVPAVATPTPPPPPPGAIKNILTKQASLGIVKGTITAVVNVVPPPPIA